MVVGPPAKHSQGIRSQRAARPSSSVYFSRSAVHSFVRADTLLPQETVALQTSRVQRGVEAQIESACREIAKYCRSWMDADVCRGVIVQLNGVCSVAHVGVCGKPLLRLLCFLMQVGSRGARLHPTVLIVEAAAQLFLTLVQNQVLLEAFSANECGEVDGVPAVQMGDAFVDEVLGAALPPQTLVTSRVRNCMQDVRQLCVLAGSKQRLRDLVAALERHHSDAELPGLLLRAAVAGRCVVANLSRFDRACAQVRRSVLGAAAVTTDVPSVSLRIICGSGVNSLATLALRCANACTKHLAAGVGEADVCCSAALHVCLILASSNAISVLLEPDAIQLWRKVLQESLLQQLHDTVGSVSVQLLPSAAVVHTLFSLQLFCAATVEHAAASGTGGSAALAALNSCVAAFGGSGAAATARALCGESGEKLLMQWCADKACGPKSVAAIVLKCLASDCGATLLLRHRNVLKRVIEHTGVSSVQDEILSFVCAAELLLRRDSGLQQFGGCVCAQVRDLQSLVKDAAVPHSRWLPALAGTVGAVGVLEELCRECVPAVCVALSEPADDSQSPVYASAQAALHLSLTVLNSVHVSTIAAAATPRLVDYVCALIVRSCRLVGVCASKLADCRDVLAESAQPYNGWCHTSLVLCLLRCHIQVFHSQYVSEQFKQVYTEAVRGTFLSWWSSNPADANSKPASLMTRSFQQMFNESPKSYIPTATLIASVLESLGANEEASSQSLNGEMPAKRKCSDFESASECILHQLWKVPLYAATCAVGDAPLSTASQVLLRVLKATGPLPGRRLRERAWIHKLMTKELQKTTAGNEVLRAFNTREPPTEVLGTKKLSELLPDVVLAALKEDQQHRVAAGRAPGEV
eukprot:TRINITY_DN9258_c4_g1_i1.p1 TRINITY_DN9258_c4_g1~~TRINITY_DN9258_c4_g1_i1.p1  ORF type:complete len:1018 (+),score=144.79 TRINITY_DN9258_c4_g1_i1:459-3056(+)